MDEALSPYVFAGVSRMRGAPGDVGPGGIVRLEAAAAVNWSWKVQKTK
jgi:hypothetical protein